MSAIASRTERAVIRAMPRVTVSARDVLGAAFSFVLVATLGFAHGGFFATTWGWAALGCLWVGAIALVVAERVEIGRFDASLVGGLTAVVSFTALSWLWSDSPPAALQEAQRGLLVLGAVLAVLLIGCRRPRPLLAGVAGGIFVVSCYGLATRLFPEQLGSFDPIAGYRLSEPLGYWNALGIYAAIGLLLALAFAARAKSRLGRAFGWSAPVFLLPTIYFTFGRGPLGALVLGLAAAVAVDRRRLQLISVAILLSPFLTAAVLLSARESDLNRRAAALSTAASDGRRLALSLLLLGVAAAAAGLGVHALEPRLMFGRAAQRRYGALLLALLVAAGVVGLAKYGSPQELASRAYDSFKAKPVEVAPSESLSRRFLSLGSYTRVRQWRVALDDYRAHPWLGSGAGTYERAWMQLRPSPPWNVRDAHSLYLEVLAELGPLGLGLLGFALSVPLAAGLRARSHPVVPFAFAAYVAFLVHAGVDWDWEMPAVTLAGFLCAVALLVAARSRDERIVSPRLRVAGAAALLSLAVFVFVGLIGNLALASSRNAARNSNWNESARQARTASRWAPWSAEPWQQLGEAQLRAGQYAAAQRSFRKALAKDPNNWYLWFDLGGASTGTARRQAVAEALRLNPLSPEIAETMPVLARQLKQGAASASP